MFHVGQKVVCVDVSGFGPFYANSDGMNYPVLGTVYAVREIAIFENEPHLLLCDLRNDSDWNCRDGQTREPGFEAWRFRPIVSRKTNISIFEAMLTDAPAKVSADA